VRILLAEIFVINAEMFACVLKSTELCCARTLGISYSQIYTAQYLGLGSCDNERTFWLSEPLGGRTFLVAEPYFVWPNFLHVTTILYR
jgi:hypothetical protein